MAPYTVVSIQYRPVQKVIEPATYKWTSSRRILGWFDTGAGATSVVQLKQHVVVLSDDD